MLEINNITKTYNTNKVLKGVSFSIKEGEIVTILGNNGAGKTTILNCILKLVKIDSGEITFFNKNIYSLNNNYFKDISVLLESSVNVYDYLTGFDNIEYFMGLSKINIKRNIKELNYYVKLFQLENFINNPVGTYSRGMKQKLALIIALISKPKILLLDEPTLGLDLQSKALVIKRLKEIVKNEKISIILTTHQMDVVENLGGKVLFLRKGLVEEINIKDLTKAVKNSFIISYHEKDQIIKKRENMNFKEICEKYKNYNIESISNVKTTLEDIVLEKLNESNKM